jgi:hypothetical protein
MNLNKNNNIAKLDSVCYLPLKNDKEKSIKNESPDKYLISKVMYEFDTNKKIPFKLIRSKRRKTTEIIDDKNENILRVPFNKPQ